MGGVIELCPPRLALIDELLLLAEVLVHPSHLHLPLLFLSLLFLVIELRFLNALTDLAVSLVDGLHLGLSEI